MYAGSSYRITLWSTLTSAWEDMEVALRLAAIVVELKEDVVPKTARNFQELAESKQAGNGYKGSRAHRIIPGSAGNSAWCFCDLLPL